MRVAFDTKNKIEKVFFSSNRNQRNGYRFNGRQGDNPPPNNPRNSRPRFNGPPRDNVPRPGDIDRPAGDDDDRTPMQRLLGRYMNRGTRDGDAAPLDSLQGIRGDNWVRIN